MMRCFLFTTFLITGANLFSADIRATRVAELDKKQGMKGVVLDQSGQTIYRIGSVNNEIMCIVCAKYQECDEVKMHYLIQIPHRESWIFDKQHNSERTVGVFYAKRRIFDNNGDRIDNTAMLFCYSEQGGIIMAISKEWGYDRFELSGPDTILFGKKPHGSNIFEDFIAITPHGVSRKGIEIEKWQSVCYANQKLLLTASLIEEDLVFARMLSCPFRVREQHELI